MFHTAEGLLALRDQTVQRLPVAMVPVADLVITESPRTEGEDSSYTQALAAAESPLPAILVHRPTMRVIDGMHRLCAARLDGRTEIAVRFFTGTEQEAFLLSVACNVAHGRPLSMADRVAAAVRIFQEHPQWSDRSVAAIAGLSAHKVAEVRRERGGAQALGATRIGQDGKARPLDSSLGRELACRLLTEDPHAPLRQIARQAGISPATVADVRKRMLRGEDPVPARQRACSGQSEERRTVAVRRTAQPVSPARLMALSEALRKDPSLRFNEVGRVALRLFETCAQFSRYQQAVIDNVPPHCKRPMAELLTSYARLWQSYADELEQEAVPLGRAL